MFWLGTNGTLIKMRVLGKTLLLKNHGQSREQLTMIIYPFYSAFSYKVLRKTSCFLKLSAQNARVLLVISKSKNEHEEKMYYTHAGLSCFTETNKLLRSPTLNLYNVVWQLYLNKAGVGVRGEDDRKFWVNNTIQHIWGLIRV